MMRVVAFYKTYNVASNRANLHSLFLSYFGAFVASWYRCLSCRCSKKVWNQSPRVSTRMLPITESGYTKAHRENTKAILDSINESVYEMISHSRNFSMAFDNSVWKAVHGYGTMTADNAQEIKLIDYLPKVNPVFDLIRMNDDCTTALVNQISHFGATRYIQHS